MRIAIDKREIIIPIIISTIILLAFPFIPKAVEMKEITDITADNQEWLGKIQVNKTVKDSQNDEPNLSGFEFSLYRVIDEEENFVESKITNEEGILEFDNLIEGIYKLYETKLDNYTGEMNDQGIELSITKDEDPEGVFIVEVVNTRLYPEETINEETEQIIEEVDIEEFDLEDMDEWEIVIIDEPIPGAAPVIEKVESITSREEIEIITTLPKTGELNSIPQSGIGAILVLLGVYINKKKMN